MLSICFIFLLEALQRNVAYVTTHWPVGIDSRLTCFFGFVDITLPVLSVTSFYIQVCVAERAEHAVDLGA